MKEKLNNLFKPPQINIGIIGCGEHVMRSHVPYLLADSNVHITQYSDPDYQQKKMAEMPEWSRNGHAALYPKRAFSNDDIFADDTINAVIIGSPDEFHPEQLRDAVTAGKHVFVEKPLAIDSQGMSMVIDALAMAREKDLVVMTCHPRRFDRSTQMLKALHTHEPSLGDPSIIGHIKFFEFNFQYHEVTEAWKKNRSLLLDHFGHEIDLMRYVFDRRERHYPLVVRTVEDSYKKFHVEGTLGGTRFSFLGERNLTEHEFREQMIVHGEIGSMEMNVNTGEITISFNDSQRESIHHQHMPKSYEKMFTLVNQNFIRAIRRECEPYTNYDDLIVNNLSGVILDLDEFYDSREWFEIE